MPESGFTDLLIAGYTRATADAAFTKVGLARSGCAGCHMNANTRQQTGWVFWSLRQEPAL